jgi:protein-S-isoprenylcysteine O-methyltransferase Ste14
MLAMSRLEKLIPPPVVLLIVAGLMWVIARYDQKLAVADAFRYAVAAALFVLALMIALTAVMAFAKAATTVNPHRVENTSALVTGGIFGFTRNPMYVGMALVLLAWVVFLAAPWTLLGPVAFVLYITRFQIIPEEHALAAKFGAAYADYCARVRRWL